MPGRVGMYLQLWYTSPAGDTFTPVPGSGPDMYALSDRDVSD